MEDDKNLHLEPVAPTTGDQITQEAEAAADFPQLASDEVISGSVEPMEQGGGRLRRRWNMALRSGQTALVLAELAPTNELARLAIFSSTEALTRNSVASGLALGLSTFAIESAGGLVAADLFETDVSKKVFHAIRRRSKHVDAPPENELPAAARTAAKTFWTFMGGTVVGMTLEQRDNPNRTKEQNRRYSLFTSTWQGGALAMIGFTGSEFVNATLENPEKGAVIAGAIGAIGGAGALLRKKIGAKGATLLEKFSKNRTKNEHHE